MNEDPLPQSEIILYQTDDGRTRIQCRFENETLWLTQVQIAELFQTSVPNINLHLKAIYAEGELAAEATIKSHLMVRLEGARQVSRPVLHYSLPVILFAWMRAGGDRRVIAPYVQQFINSWRDSRAVLSLEREWNKGVAKRL